MNRKLILFSLLFALTFPFGHAEAKTYNAKQLKGSYSMVMSGMITFVGGTVVSLPTWYSGEFKADGRGKITAIEGTFNVGGCFIVRLSGTGTYSVNSNGTGSAPTTVSVEPLAASAACPSLGFTFPSSIGFDFVFSLLDKKSGHIVITSLKDAAGNSIAAFGASGEAVRQD